jgi:PhnB protein
MLADEFSDFGYLGPKARGGSSVGIQLYVEDVDAFAEKANAAGATLDRPVTDQFYGDRTCTLTDPFGHVWYIATRIEEVSLEEMQRRAAELFGAQ